MFDVLNFCDVFPAPLRAYTDQKIWVHFALNYRVSVFVYLYRRAVLQHSDAQARLDLEAIWKPDGVWADFLQHTLRSAAL